MKPPSASGTVYVCPQSIWPSGDVAGCLLLDTGEVPWSHMSSSMGWLTRDLTSGFTDRREELERRYPDGYTVVVAERAEDIPAAVRARNAEWVAAEKDSQQPSGGAA